MGVVVLHLAVLAIALFLPQEKNEAEELFKRMEEKLLKAKTLQCMVEGVVEPIKLKLSGELWLDEGNRARMELEGKTEEVNRSAVIISDGRTVRKAQDENARSIVASERYGTHVRTCFARFGFLGMTDQWDDTVADPLETRRLSGFRLGAKEKVGEREAQAVEYRIGGEPAEVTLWIDLKSHLPLKRTVTQAPQRFGKMGEVTVIREMYADVKLDERVDPAKFELSKEKK